MPYGLATFVDGVDIITTTIPFNPVLSVKFNKVAAGTYVIDLPPDPGTIVFTNTIDRPQVDKVYTGTTLSTPTNVIVGTNSVTFTFTNVKNGDDVQYYTFYRKRI